MAVRDTKVHLLYNAILRSMTLDRVRVLLVSACVSKRFVGSGGGGAAFVRRSDCLKRGDAHVLQDGSPLKDGKVLLPVILLFLLNMSKRSSP